LMTILVAPEHGPSSVTGVGNAWLPGPRECDLEELTGEHFANCKVTLQG
jgi:hypothetical protein